VEVAPFEDDGRLVAKRLEVATELMQGDTGLDRHSEVGLVDGQDVVHPFVGQNDVANDKAWGDGMHGSDDFDFCIPGISIFDDSLDLADAAGLFELVVQDVELDLVIPIDEARHIGCRMELD
jgi:hypothetical protein